MDNCNIRSVAIIGGGVVGWMSAAFLSAMLGPSIVVTLIDLGEDNDVSFDEGSIPPLKAFHHQLGINEADLIAKTQGSMKLGTQFVNWGALGNRYFHPHGAYGAEFDAVALHQWWLKARALNPDTPPLDDFSMAWGLANDGRFSHPSPDRRLIHSTFDYAYHLDAQLYCDYLANYARLKGVIYIESALNDVELDGDTGFVRRLNLAQDRTAEADLFIDCSGSKRRLIGDALGTEFDDWSNYLPCDRMMTVSCAKGGAFNPYTRITARDAGWQWRIPLQHRTSMGYVFASQFMTDEDARASLMDNLDGRSLNDPVVKSFVNGRAKQSFIKNVVALGGAAGFLEPLEATCLHMVQSGLSRLLALWPHRNCNPLITREYNALTAREWDLARDFLILHYKATTRTDSLLWRACHSMDVPESLEVRMQHWLSSGRLVSPGSEVFQSASWLSVFVGQGLIPTAWDPLADARADRVDYVARLTGIKRVIDETVAQLPLHRDWIDKHARGAKT